MKNIAIILDPAHGENVKGKCSPDGKHKEYLWSRERVASIKKTLVSLGYKVYTTTESINEPGLTYRKNVANAIKEPKKLLISLHNNAAGSDGKWHLPKGASVFTTKGVTNSDICADIIMSQFKCDFPEVNMRCYMDKYLQRDFEENFTVLMGSSYMGVLVEWLFQDNQSDVCKLLDMRVNRRFEESLIRAIETINTKFA